MKRVGLDTNVVVSFVTDRHPGQQTRAAELFGAAVAGELVLVLPQPVITEAVYVLCNLYGTEAKIVSAVMRNLLSLPGMVVADQIDWPEVWRLWPRRVKDFGDACTAAMGMAGAFDELATFDAAFAKRARRLGVAPHWSLVSSSS